MLHQHLKQRSAKLGLRGRDLASLVGMSPSKMSDYVKGRIALDAVKEKEIILVLEDLERLPKFFPIPIGSHDIKELALALERLRQGKFNSFEKLMGAISWDTPEGLERKFPKIFKTADVSKKSEALNLKK